MKDEIAPTLPLNETEIDQLDDFLTSDSAPDAAMDVSMMDGFMTALASGPNLMMPGTMLGWIWDAEHGQDLPTFASADESKGIVGLIIRHWNSVNDMLNDASAGYEPLILEHESDGRVISVIDDWCEGYYKSIAVDRTAWAPVLAEHPEWFTVIMLYGTEEGKRLAMLAITHIFAEKPGNLADITFHVRAIWPANDRRTNEVGSAKKFRQANFRTPDYGSVLALCWNSCGRAWAKRFPSLVRIGPRPKRRTGSCLMIASANRTS